MKSTLDTPLLSISHLKKTYDGTHFVLNDISMQVQKGEVIVILGPSGCGKSTFLRCINGLESTQGGEISLSNEIINHPKAKWSKIRQRIYLSMRTTEFLYLMNLMLKLMKVERIQFQ